MLQANCLKKERKGMLISHQIEMLVARLALMAFFKLIPCAAYIKFSLHR